MKPQRADGILFTVHPFYRPPLDGNPNNDHPRLPKVGPLAITNGDHAVLPSTTSYRSFGAEDGGQGAV